MANLLQAVNQYGPKIDLQRTAQLGDLAEFTAMRTGLNKSEVMMSLQEESEAILFFCRDGKPVKLPGIGTFTPGIGRDGTFSINFRADMDLKNGMNTPNTFKGVIANLANAGITNEKLKELWDADHPDDLLTI
jgi:hypothetical protein